MLYCRCFHFKCISEDHIFCQHLQMSVYCFSVFLQAYKGFASRNCVLPLWLPVMLLYFYENKKIKFKLKDCLISCSNFQHLAYNNFRFQPFPQTSQIVKCQLTFSVINYYSAPAARNELHSRNFQTYLVVQCNILIMLICFSPNRLKLKH